MKLRTLSVLAGVGLMAGTALAGGNATYTPLNGTFGSPFNNGVIRGFGFTPTGGGGGGPAGLGNLYDNILTINGGAATAGFFGPLADIPGTQAFVDWVGAETQWGDDLHEVGNHTGGMANDVVTQLFYGYSNSVATTTHIIKIYEMVPPSIVPSSTTLIEGAADGQHRGPGESDRYLHGDGDRVQFFFWSCQPSGSSSRKLDLAFRAPSGSAVVPVTASAPLTVA